MGIQGVNLFGGKIRGSGVDIRNRRLYSFGSHPSSPALKKKKSLMNPSCTLELGLANKILIIKMLL